MLVVFRDIKKFRRRRKKWHKSKVYLYLVNSFNSLRITKDVWDIYNTSREVRLICQGLAVGNYKLKPMKRYVGSLHISQPLVLKYLSDNRSVNFPLILCLWKEVGLKRLHYLMSLAFRGENKLYSLTLLSLLEVYLRGVNLKSLRREVRSQRFYYLKQMSKDELMQRKARRRLRGVWLLNNKVISSKLLYRNLVNDGYKYTKVQNYLLSKNMKELKHYAFLYKKGWTKSVRHSLFYKVLKVIKRLNLLSRCVYLTYFISYLLKIMSIWNYVSGKFNNSRLLVGNSSLRLPMKRLNLTTLFKSGLNVTKKDLYPSMNVDIVKLMILRNRSLYRALKRMDIAEVGEEFIHYLHLLRLNMQRDLQRTLNKKYDVKFKFLMYHNITCELLSEYIVIRLRKRDRVKTILKGIKRRLWVDFGKRHPLDGFKIKKTVRSNRKIRKHRLFLKGVKVSRLPRISIRWKRAKPFRWWFITKRSFWIKSRIPSVMGKEGEPGNEIRTVMYKRPHIQIGGLRGSANNYNYKSNLDFTMLSWMYKMVYKPLRYKITRKQRRSAIRRTRWRMRRYLKVCNNGMSPVEKRNLIRGSRGDNGYWINLGEMLKGYKVECRGMFIRKHSSRSQSYVIQRGKTSINTKSIDLEYLQRKVTLRTGSCSIRVWLLRKYDHTLLEAKKVKLRK